MSHHGLGGGRIYYERVIQCFSIKTLCFINNRTDEGRLWW